MIGPTDLLTSNCSLLRSFDISVLQFLYLPNSYIFSNFSILGGSLRAEQYLDWRTGRILLCYVAPWGWHPLPKHVAVLITVNTCVLVIAFVGGCATVLTVRMCTVTALRRVYWLLRFGVTPCILVKSYRRFGVTPFLLVKLSKFRRYAVPGGKQLSTFGRYAAFTGTVIDVSALRQAYWYSYRRFGVTSCLVVNSYRSLGVTPCILIQLSTFRRYTTLTGKLSTFRRYAFLVGKQLSTFRKVAVPLHSGHPVQGECQQSPIFMKAALRTSHIFAGSQEQPCTELWMSRVARGQNADIS